MGCKVQNDPAGKTREDICKHDGQQFHWIKYLSKNTIDINCENQIQIIQLRKLYILLVMLKIVS